MNKFAEMTTFVSVVDAHSFSEAARRLGTTKSQVSQRIQQLERRLGRVLLNRTRPLSLTDPGRTYYEHACRLLQELEQAEASVLDADDDLRGQLRLSAPLAFTPRYLAPLLARFAERHPQLRVDVQADDRFVNLQEPRFDMALRMGRLDDSCLVARPTRMLPWASTRIVSCGPCRGCPASSRSRPFPPPCVSSTRATTKATRRWRRCPSTR